ncbi:MAG: substrate-binding domain-containing protein [Lentisphaeria bacterium]|nr:substrate-binding domain-containing protein [Lentisphaeria bacterium]
MAKFQYRMIAEKILADIKREILLPGMNVPSSRELSRTYGVSQITALHALDFLAKRGILLHKSGQNYSVSRKTESLRNDCRFLTMLFRHISTNGQESYGNRIISGVMREAAIASAGIYYSFTAAQTISAFRTDFFRTLEEALRLPRQNLGFIADYQIPDKIIEEIRYETQLPVVVIGRASALADVHSVVPEALPGYRFTLQNLKRLGYDAFICCESHDMRRYECLQRRQFFQELAEREKSVICPEYTNFADSQQRDFLNRAFRSLAGSRTAVFAPSDATARAIMKHVEALGMTPGKDVGIVGFYGTRLATEYSPKLCGLSVQPELLGKTAAQLLLSRDSQYKVHEIPMTFIFGETI